MNKSRNLELDRLRGVAILLTVLIHYVRIFFPWNIHQSYNHGAGIANIWMNSWTGVDLFFVISGYIISKKLIEELDHNNSNIGLVRTIKQFYCKRFFRIYPVCIVTFLLVLFATIFINKSGGFGDTENAIEAGIAIFTYTFNYYFAYGFYHNFSLSPNWSLSVEAQFYLIYPLFLLLISKTRNRVICLSGLLILITLIIRPCSPINSLFLSQTRCDGLIYGCLLYFISRTHWYTSLAPHIIKNKFYVKILFIFTVVLLAGIPGIGLSNNIVIPVACIISMILVMFASFEKELIISFLPIQNFLDYLGRRSYSMYLVHLPMFSLTHEIYFRLSSYYDFPINSALWTYYSITMILLVVIATEVLYKFVEIPFIKKSKRIVNGLTSSEWYCQKDSLDSIEILNKGEQKYA